MDEDIAASEGHGDAGATAAEPTEATELEDTVPAAQPPPVDLKREHLSAEMPEEQFDAVVGVTHDLLNRRFKTACTLMDVAAAGVNLNPFLMLAMAPAYNIFSPFEAAEYVQYAKLPHGDATAFGRFVEERIFPIFGAGWPDEKPKSKAQIAADKDGANVFSAIDGELNVDGKRYLVTYKSGPWTMNQSHANEMIANFPKVHEQTGCDIIIGITYGKQTSVNNKPNLVIRETGPYVHTLVGQPLWEFITGVREAHFSTFLAIREAQRRFAEEHGGKTFYEHLIEARLKLAESFRKAFNLKGADDEMWELIFRGSF